MTALSRAGNAAAKVVSVILVARLGPASLGVLAFLAVMLASVACWVVYNEDRTDRVSRVLLAWRGNARCLTKRRIAVPGQPGLMHRHRPRPRS
jgi:hypothetical protein